MARALGETVINTMRNVEVMSILGHKSTAYRAVKNYTSLLLYVPKTLFTTWFEFQVKVIKLPVVVVFAIWKLVPCSLKEDLPQVIQDAFAILADLSQEPNELNQVIERGSDSDPNVPSVSGDDCSEPRSEDVVRNMKRLRNCVALSIDQFTGEDLFWDVPILSRKVKRLSDAIVEGDKVKIKVAKKILKRHPVVLPKPKSKKEYDRLLKEVEEEHEHSAVETVPKTLYDNSDPVDGKTKCESSLIDTATENKCRVSVKSGGKVCFNSDKEELSKQNETLKERLSQSYDKLDEVIRLSNAILEEVKRLNDQFKGLTELSLEITSLQNELEKGKQMLQVVENERNEMRQKLLDIAKLIKEEEEYLDEIAGESGYEEVDNVSDGPDELKTSKLQKVPNMVDNTSDSSDESETTSDELETASENSDDEPETSKLQKVPKILCASSV